MITNQKDFDNKNIGGTEWVIKGERRKEEENVKR